MLNRWINLCQRIRPSGASDNTPARLFLYLEAMYDRQGHHTLSHIESCLSVLDTVRHQFRVAGIPKTDEAIEFALWLHDAVYYPGAPENESKSAAVAVSMLQELSGGSAACPAKPQDVQRLIMATVPLEDSEAKDEQIVSDIDLSVLAGSAGEYDEYAELIQDEFLHLVEAAGYRARRGNFLERLLQRPIFQTYIMRDMFEDAARDNVTRELRSLNPESFWVKGGPAVGP